VKSAGLGQWLTKLEWYKIVFSTCQKVIRNIETHTADGILFYTCEVATENAWLSKVDCPMGGCVYLID